MKKSAILFLLFISIFLSEIVEAIDDKNNAELHSENLINNDNPIDSVELKKGQTQSISSSGLVKPNDKQEDNAVATSTGNLSVDKPRSLSASKVDNTKNILTMLLALSGIVLLIIIVVWGLKKIGFTGYGSNGNLIKIKSSLALSAKEKLLLIELGEEQILIATAPGFIGHIKTLDTPVSTVSQKDSLSYSNSKPSVFSDKLNSILNKKDLVD